MNIHNYCPQLYCRNIFKPPTSPVAQRPGGVDNITKVMLTQSGLSSSTFVNHADLKKCWDPGSKFRTWMKVPAGAVFSNGNNFKRIFKEKLFFQYDAGVSEWSNELASGHPEETASSLVLAQVRKAHNSLESPAVRIFSFSKSLGLIRGEATYARCLRRFDS